MRGGGCAFHSFSSEKAEGLLTTTCGRSLSSALHLPREQTMRHVHVNEGGQAVIADQFHYYPGASENGKTTKQSEATASTGASPALPCPDTFGLRMPIPSRERLEAVPNAWRN